MGSTPSPLPPAHEEPAYRVFLDSLDYLAPLDVERIKAAYAFAARAHASQKRMSGEPDITQPLAVAGAVVEWRMAADAGAAVLLHEVLEDTGATQRELAEKFGKEVAELVDGLSKLDKMEFASYQEAQAENFRKMLMAMARALRLGLNKLYRELQDTSFHLIYPHRAEVLAKALKAARGNRNELLTRILDG